MARPSLYGEVYAGVRSDAFVVALWNG